MAKYRKYTREISKNELNDLKIRHKIHLKNKGFLSPNKKRRLLRIGKKEHGTSDSEFWYRIKHQSKFGLFDLELIAKIADESQLQEIFQHLTKEDYIERKKGKYYRTDFRSLIEAVFSSHKPEESTRDDWRFKIAVDMITIGTGYIRNMPAFQSKLHNRMFEEVLDVVDETRDSSESAFS